MRSRRRPGGPELCGSDAPAHRVGNRGLLIPSVPGAISPLCNDADGEFPFDDFTPEENLGHDLFYDRTNACARFCRSSSFRADGTLPEELYTPANGSVYFNLGGPRNPFNPFYPMRLVRDDNGNSINPDRKTGLTFPPCSPRSRKSDRLLAEGETFETCCENPDNLRDIGNLCLSDKEEDQIVAYLKTLTDTVTISPPESDGRANKVKPPKRVKRAER